MEKSAFATSGSERALGKLHSLEIACKVQNIDEIQTYDLSGRWHKCSHICMIHALNPPSQLKSPPISAPYFNVYHRLPPPSISLLGEDIEHCNVEY